MQCVNTYRKTRCEPTSVNDRIILEAGLKTHSRYRRSHKEGRDYLSKQYVMWIQRGLGLKRSDEIGEFGIRATFISNIYQNESWINHLFECSSWEN